jgi:hypothetical protein
MAEERVCPSVPWYNTAGEAELLSFLPAPGLMEMSLMNSGDDEFRVFADRLVLEAVGFTLLQETRVIKIPKKMN